MGHLKQNEILCSKTSKPNDQLFGFREFIQIKVS